MDVFKTNLREFSDFLEFLFAMNNRFSSRIRIYNDFVKILLKNHIKQMRQFCESMNMIERVLFENVAKNHVHDKHDFIKKLNDLNELSAHIQNKEMILNSIPYDLQAHNYSATCMSCDDNYWEIKDPQKQKLENALDLSIQKAESFYTFLKTTMQSTTFREFMRGKYDPNQYSDFQEIISDILTKYKARIHELKEVYDIFFEINNR